MKRYLVFYGDSYYALGGMKDFEGSFDDLNNAIGCAKNAHLKNRPDDKEWGWAWAHIFDTKTMSEVWCK